MLETLTDAEKKNDARWESIIEAATAVAALILRRLYDKTDIWRALSHAETIVTFAVDERED